MIHRLLRHIAAPVLLLVIPPLPAQGQAVLLDEGTFQITVEGREVGTEAFTIHRVGLGEGSEILATGTVQTQGRTMRPALKTATDYRPVSYQNTVSGDQASELSIVLSGTRYESRMTGPEGEMEREYRAGAGTLLLEGRVAHHYFFLARSAPRAGDRLRVILPVEGRQEAVEVRSVAREDVRLGREVVPARHFVLRFGGHERHLWVDDDGRVLRVEIPGEGWVAERRSQR
jgi:hypothetical protein